MLQGCDIILTINTGGIQHLLHKVYLGNRSCCGQPK